MSNIDHPDHYNRGRTLDADGTATYEPIKVIEAMGMGYEFCIGNAIKYILRAPHKVAEREDLEKAVWYLLRAHDDGPRPDRARERLGGSFLMDAASDWGLEGRLLEAMQHIADRNPLGAAECVRLHLA